MCPIVFVCWHGREWKGTGRTTTHPHAQGAPRDAHYLLIAEHVPHTVARQHHELVLSAEYCLSDLRLRGDVRTVLPIPVGMSADTLRSTHTCNAGHANMPDPFWPLLEITPPCACGLAQARVHGRVRRGTGARRLRHIFVLEVHVTQRARHHETAAHAQHPAALPPGTADRPWAGRDHSRCRVSGKISMYTL